MSAVAALMTACSSSTPTTVNLIPTTGGKVSGVLGLLSDTSVSAVQVRLTSGTGKAVEVRPTSVEAIPADDQVPVTVIDDGTWVTVTPVHPVIVHPMPLPSTNMLRFTTTSATAMTLRLEIRSLNQSGQPGGTTAIIPVTGADCGRVKPHTDQSAVDLTGADLRNCTIPGVTLSPSKLANATLTGADLSGATILPGSLATTRLSATRLVDATLDDVNLGGDLSWNLAFVDLTGAHVHNIGLAGTTLYAATLGSIDLSTATLTGVSTGRITGAPTLPAGWLLRNGYLVHRTAKLSDADLHGADLHGFDFTGADITFVNLAGADLHDATFAGANLQSSTLTGANLDGADLGTAKLVRDDGFGGVTGGGIVGVPASLPPGWALVNGNLAGYGAHLSGADLSGATLAGVDLRKAELGGVNLTGTDLAGANLTGALLGGAIVTGAKFDGATLTGLNSGNLVGTPATLPPSWRLIAGALVGPTAIVSIDVSGADLSNLDLHGLQCFCTMTGVNLSGSDVSGGHVQNLTNANLTNADLSGSFVVTTITGATVTGTKFANAIFGGLQSGGLIGVPTSLPANTSFFGGYLLGRGTLLVDVDLSGKDLRGQTFAQSELDSVNLSSTDLRGVSFFDASFRGATLANSQIDGVDFTSALLFGEIGIGTYNLVDLNGTTGTPIYAGGTFYAVRCPDGTLAADHGQTCQGHPWP